MTRKRYLIRFCAAAALYSLCSISVPAAAELMINPYPNGKAPVQQAAPQSAPVIPAPVGLEHFDIEAYYARFEKDAPPVVVAAPSAEEEVMVEALSEEDLAFTPPTVVDEEQKAARAQAQERAQAENEQRLAILRAQNEELLDELHSLRSDLERARMQNLQTAAGSEQKTLSVAAEKPAEQKITKASVPPVMGVDEYYERFVPRPAPQQPAMQGKSWAALDGMSVREVLGQWSSMENVEFLWNAGADFTVLQPLEVFGSYENAVTMLLGQYDQAQTRPVGSLYVDSQNGRHVLVIDSLR